MTGEGQQQQHQRLPPTAASKEKAAAASSTCTTTSNAANSTSSKSNKNNDDANQQMENVLQLLNQRMEGEVTTVQVESAVSDLLTTMGAKTTAVKPRPPKKHSASTSAQAAPEIRGDTGNYDDSSSDEDDNDSNNTTNNNDNTLTGDKKNKDNDDTSKSKTTKKRRRDDENNTDVDTDKKTNEGHPKPKKRKNDKRRLALISEIPMGTEAAKMMTTFGDGPQPDPNALTLALMGTRKALQVSIMDARKVRRRLQAEYREAQAIMTIKYDRSRSRNHKQPTVEAAAKWQQQQQQQQQQQREEQQEAVDGEQQQQQLNFDDNHKTISTPVSAAAAATPSPTKTKTVTAGSPIQYIPANSIDPKLLYRALAEGTDKLSYAPRCGFHMEELTHLYPEEMRAFQRCHEMHEDFNESKEKGGKKNANANGTGTGGDNNAGDADGNADDTNGDKTKAEKDSNSANNNKNDDDDDLDGGHLRERAANFDFRTDQMKNDWYVEYSKVRLGSFLPSKGGGGSSGSKSLNSSTRNRRSKTERDWDKLRKIKKECHAYDRLGRIVEKAIFLRNEHDSEATSLWELPFGKQLSEEDIERALQDPDVKPATVYGGGSGSGASNTGSGSGNNATTTKDAAALAFSSHSIQLYFGPGWEDRLELEMEEMIASAKGGDRRLSEEERMVRSHELELLTKISKPPEKEGVLLEALVKKHKESLAMIAKEHKKKAATSENDDDAAMIAKEEKEKESTSDNDGGERDNDDDVAVIAKEEREKAATSDNDGGDKDNDDDVAIVVKEEKEKTATSDNDGCDRDSDNDVCV